MTTKPKFQTKPPSQSRAGSGLTRPGELYVHGDSLPVPEVIEKNTDSVWALWSDAVDGTDSRIDHGADAQDDEDERDRGPDTIPATQMMDLDDLPKERGK